MPTLTMPFTRGALAGLLTLVALTLTASNASAARTAGIDGLNGTWQLVKDESQDFEDAADEVNDEINRKRREEESGFNRQRSGTNSGRANRFQGQMDATQQMINEDGRSIDWGSPVEIRQLMVARSLRLYQARKVVLIYDGERKRTLAINPAGRAFSISGTEINQDDIGRTLAYFEDDALVVETEIHTGGRLTERFAYQDEPERLRVLVTREIRKGGDRLEFVRVFERGS